MRDKVKRFISILMTALMLVNLMPVGALAEGFTISNSVQSIGWGSEPDPKDAPMDTGHVYVYVKIDGASPETLAKFKLNPSGWYTIGSIAKTMPGEAIWSKSSRQWVITPTPDNDKTYQPREVIGGVTLPDYSIVGLDPWEDNKLIPLNEGVVTWKRYKFTHGADNYKPASIASWHMDGIVNFKEINIPYTVKHVVKDSSPEIVLKEETKNQKYGQLTQATALTFEGYKQVGEIENQTIGDDPITIYVYYEPDGSTVSVNYKTDENGTLDGNTQQSVSKLTGEKLTDVTATPKKGYNFVGWYKGETGETFVTDNPVLDAATAKDKLNFTNNGYKLYQATTFTAKFEPITDTVHYTTSGHGYINSNNNTNVTQTFNVTNGNGVTGATAIEDENSDFVFVGWYKDDASGKPENLITKEKVLTADDAKKYLNQDDSGLYTNTVYHAVFKKQKNLSYTVNYYWAGDENNTIDESIHGKANLNKVIKLEDVIRDINGYTFKGASSESITISSKEEDNVLNLYYYKNVTLTSASDSKVYDGTPLTNHNVTAVGFVGEDKVTCHVTGSQKDAGNSKNTFIFVTNNEIDSKYKITKNEGTLTINPRPVTLTSEGGSKPYDGTSLTKPTVTVTGDGFVEGEVTDIEATGSVTNVSEGEVTNTITYTEGVNFKESNYDIRKTEGKLSITAVDGVVVTIKGHKGSYTYDGKEKTVQGYDVGIPEGSAYTEKDIQFNGNANLNETDANTYQMGLTAAQFANNNGNFTNVTFDVEEDGQLVINPRSVTLTSEGGNKPYDGKPLTKPDVKIGGEGFVEGEVSEIKATGSVTNVSEGEVTNTIIYTEGTNFKADNYAIEKDEGKLKITPVTDEVTVTITENSGTEKYDGTEKTVTGYTVSISNPLYKESDFTFSGNAEVKGTDAGTYDMELKASDFTNNNTNFAEVKFVIVDGSLTITPRSVTLTSASASKTYDGKPLANETVAVGGDGFATGEGATYKVTGSQTVVGESDNTFTYKLNEATLESNYDIQKVEGKLEVTPVTEEVIVTITGRTGEMPYDGKEHSVFGYDLTVSNALYNPKEDMQFNGIDADMTAKGTDAGQYDIGLTAEDFTNKSNNFSKVTFVVTDGYVKINPRAVTLTSETAGKTYDGTALEKPVVTVGGDGFVEGQVKEIKATGSVTNAGSVANTITFTPNKETFKEGNYAITKTEGTLTINKRSVLITSQSATKTYDGSALTRPAVTITGDGFVPGELAKAEATGSITNVGSTPNAIQYTTTGAFNAANYSIALSVGTLTVTERPQPEPRRTFNLTISYVYQNGKRAAASYNRGGLKNGETFDITSPVIAGYTASETVVSGTIYNRDIKVTVIYTADGVNLDDYGVPLGLGNITMNVGDCFE